MSAELL